MTDPVRRVGDVAEPELNRARSTSHEARRDKPPPTVIDWDAAIARFKKTIAKIYRD